MGRARVLVAVTLVLAGIAWVWGNPPSGAPDELTHYVKALGVGGGELAGRSPSHGTSVGSVDYANLAALIRAGQGVRADEPTGRQADRLVWMRGQTRRFTIPQGLAVNTLCASKGPMRVPCLEELRGSPRETVATTPMGTYVPLPYVVPGLAARAAHDPITAIRLGRLASAALCLGLIALAAAATWDGRRGGALALLGLVTALSPAVLLLATVINPSGPEITGAVAFTAGLLAVMRPGGSSRLAWTAVAAGGAFLAGSRSFGPIFVALTVVAVAALTGRRGLRTAIAASRTPAIVATAVVVIAGAVNVAWELTLQPHPGIARSDVGPGIDDAVDELPRLGQQLVGVFGTGLDVPLPRPLYLAWAVLFLGVVGLAVAVGDRRERGVLAGLVLVTLGLVFVLAIAVRPTGFPMQARHLLPVAVLVPLIAGEVLRRHAEEFAQATMRVVVFAAVGIAATVHLGAWYINARAWSAGAEGPDFLVSDAHWAPPGSWIPWACAVAVAAAAYLAAAHAATRTASAGPGTAA